MSKELDYLDDILNYQSLTLGTRTIIEHIKEKIQRLETIDNAKPSEALEKLKENTEMFDEIAQKNNHSYKDDTVIEAYIYRFNNTVIEQALIKAQEQEKVLKIIKQKNVDIRTLKECFKTDYGFQEYNKHQYEKDELTQEEFDLLKRYFKNGNNL